MPLRGNAKLGLGLVVGTVMGAGAAVYADGGDAGLVHACIDEQTTTGPNVIIVAPDATCSGRFTTPKHWSIQGPQGPAGPAGETGAAGKDAPPDAAPKGDIQFSELKSAGALKLVSSAKTVTKTSATNGNPMKDAVATCPLTHPKLVTGGYDVFGIVAPNKFFVMINQAQAFGPVPRGAWHAGGTKSGAFTPWSIKVTAVCKK